MVGYQELLDATAKGTCPECGGKLLVFPGGEVDKPDPPVCPRCNWPHFEEPLWGRFKSA